MCARARARARERECVPKHIQNRHRVMGTARQTDNDIFHVLNNFIDFRLYVGKFVIDVIIQPPFLTITVRNKQ